MDPRELFEELKVEYLESGHQHCRAGWLQLRHCPFCSSDNYHLGFNLENRYFVCWRCRGHNPWKVWTALGLPRDRLRAVVQDTTSEEPVSREITRVSLSIPADVGPMATCHRQYLRDRGFKPKEVERIWKLQGIGLAARLKWRIFIPIIYRDEVVSWTTRAIGNSGQRYISASAEQEKISHKTLVYGADYCRHSIIIVEGPTDVWRIGPGAGALFGTAFTTAQVKRLIEHPYRYVVFDSSKEAQTRAAELASQLSVFAGETHIIELDAEDPGSASVKEIRRLRRATKL